MSTISVIDKPVTEDVTIYHTDHSAKLIGPETIISSRDMDGDNQNLNGSLHLTTPLSGTVFHPWASTCYRQPTY